MDVGGLTPAERHVEGAVEMMLDATQNFDLPLTEKRLCGWHAALFPTGRSGLKKITVGAWRRAETGPMQVISGPYGRERVHFEAPEAERLPGEMKAFLRWFNAEARIDPVVKAGIAHLWFVTLHPFEDGNGRIARAIADMALARSEESPRRFYSMSAQIREERNAYYEVLEAAQKGDLDIEPWLRWFLGCLDRALEGADRILATTLRKSRFWRQQADQNFNDRQRKMLNRLLDGFEGKLTSSKWAKITGTSQDTASRDIDDLLRRKVLFRGPGGGRSTSYMLIVTVADALRAAAAYTREHSRFFVGEAPAVLGPEARQSRQAAVVAIAGKIDGLAARSLMERVDHREFDELNTKLHALGFFIAPQLISAAAVAFTREEKPSPPGLRQ